MVTTRITDAPDVTQTIQKFWSPIFMKELREQLLLGALCDKTYSGEIKGLGDTVKVTQINAPTGQLLNKAVDAFNFTPEALSSSQVEVVADRRAVASYEFEDLIQLQSQLAAEDSEIRQALMFAVQKQINDYLYTLVAPQASHDLTGASAVASMSAAQLSTIRTLAAKAKWLQQKGWWGLLSPGYYEDLLNDTTIVSQDTVSDRPVVGGQISTQRYGFNLLEDNSRGAANPEALFFHPDFLHLVMQQAPRFKVSDLHSNKQFGYVISVDLVLGAKLGIAGDAKHIYAATV